MFKACVKNENGNICELVRFMTHIVRKFWRWENVLMSWLDAMFLPLCKRRGARKDWKNWRGIVLLNIASEIHAILLNGALKNLSNRSIQKTQVGLPVLILRPEHGRAIFCPEHGSADGLLVIRRILEYFRSLRGDNMGIFLLFVDWKKAFDSVDRSVLWFLLEKRCGVPENIGTAIRKLHDGMNARTLYRGELGQSFDMSTGARYGAIEGSTSWIIFYAFLLFDWTKRCKENSGWCSRSWFRIHRRTECLAQCVHIQYQRSRICGWSHRFWDSSNTIHRGHQTSRWNLQRLGNRDIYHKEKMTASAISQPDVFQFNSEDRNWCVRGREISSNTRSIRQRAASH